MQSEQQELPIDYEQQLAMQFEKQLQIQSEEKDIDIPQNEKDIHIPPNEQDIKIKQEKTFVEGQDQDQDQCNDQDQDQDQCQDQDQHQDQNQDQHQAQDQDQDQDQDQSQDQDHTLLILKHKINKPPNKDGMTYYYYDKNYYDWTFYNNGHFETCSENIFNFGEKVKLTESIQHIKSHFDSNSGKHVEFHECGSKIVVVYTPDNNPNYYTVIFDPKIANSIIPIAQPSVGGAAYCVLKNVLYRIGGCDAMHRRNESYEVNGSVYKLVKGKWKYVNEMIHERAYPSATVINDKIYVSGGFDEHGDDYKSMEYYDPKNGTWQMCWQRMNLERRSHTMVPIRSDNPKRNHIMVVGGLNTKTVEIYDIVKDKWTQCANLNTFSYNERRVVFSYNGRVICLGLHLKNTENGKIRDKAVEYDFDENNWKFVEDFNDELEYAVNVVVCKNIQIP
jgi:hypothetical protein